MKKTKKDNEDLENSTKCWICDNDYIDGDVKVKRSLPYSGIFPSTYLQPVNDSKNLILN